MVTVRIRMIRQTMLLLYGRIIGAGCVTWIKRRDVVEWAFQWPTKQKWGQYCKFRTNESGLKIREGNGSAG